MGIAFNDNMKKSWDFLVKKGLTEAGAAGLMGNLYSESAGFFPNRVEFLCIKRLKEHRESWTDDSYTAAVDSGKISKAKFLNPLPGKQYGYGLAQWTTPERKSGLYDLCKSLKVSIADLKTQLDWLMMELAGKYGAVYKVLTTTNDIQEASDIVLVRFESPADTSSTVKKIRADYARQIYAKYHKSPDGITASKILGIATGWIGRKESDGSHRLIIDKYNSHKPLARGYRLSYTDSWCDGFVSAVYIEAGAVDLIGGTECGVEEHIQLFKKAGIWKEDGKLTPKSAWIICYNWDDGTQPNDGYADHIGIVEKVENGQITVIEGNYKDAVGRRTIPIGCGYIRGYAVPKYASGEQQKPSEDKQDPVDCYFVRKDPKSIPVNSFHILDNAKKEADRYGYNVYDAAGKLIYSGKQPLALQIVAAAEKLHGILAADLKAGKIWRYRNSKLNATIALAQANQNRYTNCVRGVQWVLQLVGLASDNLTDLNWYGKIGGEIGGTDRGRKALTKYFDLHRIQGKKTVDQLIADGTLKSGDIVTYVSMNHTNLYLGSLGNNRWFDSGHAYCKEKSGDVPFTAWIGKTVYGSEKVGYIIRVKENAKTETGGSSASAGTGLKTAEQWVGEVTATDLNVRVYAGTEYAQIKSWPKLAKENLVGVCDTVNDKSGNPWYYIRIHNDLVDVYGFVSAKYIKKV